MPEWVKDLTAAGAVIFVVIAILKFLVGERKERRATAEDCTSASSRWLSSSRRVSPS